VASAAPGILTAQAAPDVAKRAWPRWLALGLAMLAVATTGLIWTAAAAQLLLGAIGLFLAARGALLLGGAGGLEAGITVLAVRDQVAPPTINLDDPDAECDLDYVPHQSRQMPIRYALSNSFGFGGTNAALLFKRFEG